MTSEPLTPPTRTSEKLRADLDAVNTQLTSMKKQWEEEDKEVKSRRTTCLVALGARNVSSSHINRGIRSADLLTITGAGKL